MGKRIFRLTAEEAKTTQVFLQGKDVSLVLKNGTVFLGKLQKIENQHFICENKLHKRVDFRQEDIKEVVYDLHSSY